MKKELSLTKQAGGLMIGQGAGFVIAFFIPIILVRFLSAEEYGTYKQFFLVFSTLFYMAQFGMVQSVYFFVPDNQEKSTYLTQAYLFLLSVGIVLSLLMIPLSGFIAQLINNPVMEQYLPLLGLFLCFMLGASFLEGMFISETKILHASVSFFMTEFFKAASMILPIVLARDLESLFWGVTIFGFIRFIAALFFMRHHLAEGFSKINRSTYRKQFAYALPLAGSSILTKTSFNLHHFFISFFFPPEIFAIFAVGLFYPPIVEIIEGPIKQTMFVAIVKHLKAGKEKEIRQIWHNSIRKMSLVILPILAFSFSEASHIIVIFFTENYLESVPIFMVAISRIFFVIFLPGNIIKAYGETPYILKVNAVALLVYVMNLFLLVKLFGLTGGAIGMILNEIVIKTLLVNKARTLLGFPLSASLPWAYLGQGLFISCLSTLPVYLYNFFLPEASILNVISCFILFALSYLLFLYRGSLLTMEEKKSILAFLRPKKMAA